MSDEDAYMALVTSNAQSELTPLERGIHAHRSGKDVKTYAAQAGRARTNVSNEVLAARVALSVTNVGHEQLADRWTALREIHSAPEWLWPALVERLVAAGKERPRPQRARGGQGLSATPGETKQAQAARSRRHIASGGF
jgi:hypothetical protein